MEFLEVHVVIDIFSYSHGHFSYSPGLEIFKTLENIFMVELSLRAQICFKTLI